MLEADTKILPGNASMPTISAAKRRRVLMLANSLPFPPRNGYKLRLWALLNCLAAQGCCTDFICFGDPAEVNRYREDLSRFCHRVEAIPHRTESLSARMNLPGRLAALLSAYPYAVAMSRSEPMRTRIEALLAGSAYDMVLVEEADLLLNLPSRLDVPLVVDHHNAEHVLIERYVAHAESALHVLYARLEAKKIRRWEQQATRRADIALVCSNCDRSIFQKLAPETPVLTVPNVIDLNAYTPARAEEESHTVLYTGGMDWYPNRDAVRYFVRSILPHLRKLVPDVQFVVTGRAPSAQFARQFAEIPGMRFTGALPDLRPEIARAAVCVVPLRIGSGTRLKILEAAAMGKAVVSTSIGAEGLEFANNQEIVLVDKPLEFAEAIYSLLSDPTRRRRMGQRARDLVECRYGISALAEPVAGIWRAMNACQAAAIR